MSKVDPPKKTKGIYIFGHCVNIEYKSNKKNKRNKNTQHINLRRWATKPNNLNDQGRQADFVSDKTPATKNHDWNIDCH